MSKNFKYSLVLAFALSVIPSLGHYLTGSSIPGEGIGFEVLIYEPFNFAYPISAFIIFVIINSKFSSTKNIGVSLVKSLAWSLLVFTIGFLLLTQLHLNLGGKL